MSKILLFIQKYLAKQIFERIKAQKDFKCRKVRKIYKTSKYKMILCIWNIVAKFKPKNSRALYVLKIISWILSYWIYSKINFHDYTKPVIWFPSIWFEIGFFDFCDFRWLCWHWEAGLSWSSWRSISWDAEHIFEKGEIWYWSVRVSLD